MKTQVITLVAVILFSLNVSAKTTAVSTPDEIPSSELLKTIELAEVPLVIENWMTDDQLWNEAGQELNLTETSEQEELEIESWMTNADLWKANVLFESFTSGNNTYYLVTSKKVKEEPLRIESWMTNDKFWKL